MLADKALTEQLKRYSSQVHSQVGGRAVKAENLHVTLAFLGDLNTTQIAAIIDCCLPLPGNFRIKLDRVGFWKNRGLVWIGGRQPDLEFKQFIEGLRGRMRRLGFRIDQRSFIPHITLLRKARKRPRISLDSLEWVIQEYTLSASVLGQEGARYSVLKTLVNNLGCEIMYKLQQGDGSISSR